MPKVFHTLYSIYWLYPQIETIDWTFPVSVQEVLAMGLKSYLPWITKKVLKQQTKDILKNAGVK